MGRAPEVPGRTVEPPGQLVARAALFGQRHQDRVGQRHGGSVTTADAYMQYVALQLCAYRVCKGLIARYMQRLVSATTTRQVRAHWRARAGCEIGYCRQLPRATTQRGHPDGRSRRP